MARYNDVILYGQVSKQPQLDNRENPSRGVIKLLCTRGARNTGITNKRIKTDQPVILSEDPGVLETMKEINEGDMIFVKGALTTRNLVKKHKCPQCGTIDREEGTLGFITPIYIKILERGLSLKEGNECMKEAREMSNKISLVGRLCDDPEYLLKNGQRIINYQLDVTRKYKVKGDSEDIRKDFPWIKSYGAIAENDRKHLLKNAFVLVDGLIQTREFPRESVCSHCGYTYKWVDFCTEVVPYSVEYLKDSRTEEEVNEYLAEKTARKAAGVEAALFSGGGGAEETDSDEED